LAAHIAGEVIPVQLKSCFFVALKYVGKDLYPAFPDRGEWFVGLPDEALATLQEVQGHPPSFHRDGEYFIRKMSLALRARMEPWRLSSA
jgi:hypothetical protein